jgi:uncharacterized protein YqgC (DUF456 family)
VVETTGSGLTNVLLPFVVGFVVGYVVTRERRQATRIQAGRLLGFVLFITPVAVAQLAEFFCILPEASAASALAT